MFLLAVNGACHVVRRKILVNASDAEHTGWIILSLGVSIGSFSVPVWPCRRLHCAVNPWYQSINNVEEDVLQKQAR